MKLGLGRLKRSFLERAFWLVPALGWGVGCSGTDGTLVVLHDAPSAGASSSSAGTASSAAGASDAAAGGPPIGEKPYVPAASVRWFTKLDGPVDVDTDAELFYLDAEQQDANDLAALHAAGRHYLCYLSGGSLEGFRNDAGDFPDSAVGNSLADFPREHWLDVRDATVRQLMARRVQALAASGCDGVPPSSLAVHAADTGFDLTLSDALDYARWLAERIHAAGMSAGLSGPSELTGELWPTFDFGLAIGCLTTTQCSEYAVFGPAHKPVLHVEVGDAGSAPALCKSAQMLGFDALVSDASFSGRCLACRDIL
jgi:hypothetical protein